ncbi:tRNA pseudouridine32 synthase / 23S rRNA pseudouridine746 synthase [Formivibrio citricus]|uniref:Dual-specificity RNA pseudouridine synthase RluA n=2 Tax=Formivibrio citricus TaxID=83765 RepID=A0A1I5BA95_9NEIS|nr:tRNA pseudouridine32 synthase / 23S rRNA pseudouridine746 synthase [Formivibrio citricus]
MVATHDAGCVIYSPPAHAGLEILYRDDVMLVLDKPSGLLSVPGKGEDKADCLASRVQAEYSDALVVHRLDMSTSGILVMARGIDAQRALSRSFELRETQKRYVALVSGCLRGEGVVDLPLITDWPNRPRQMVDFERGKKALTRYRAQEYDPVIDSTRVELEPVTGRSHQLRVHMLALGHPILGDDLYADAGARDKAERLLLHASYLSIPHPVTAQPLVFSSAAPF